MLDFNPLFHIKLESVYKLNNKKVLVMGTILTIN